MDDYGKINPFYLTITIQTFPTVIFITILTMKECMGHINKLPGNLFSPNYLVR